MSKKKLPAPPKELSPRKLLEYFSNNGARVCHRVYSAEVARGLCFDMFGSYCTHDDGPYIDGGLPSGGLYSFPYSISIHQEYDIIIVEEVLAISWTVKNSEGYYIIIPTSEIILDLKNFDRKDPEYENYLVRIKD